jgi:hypothetical protein
VVRFLVQVRLWTRVLARPRFRDVLAVSPVPPPPSHLSPPFFFVSWLPSNLYLLTFYFFACMQLRWSPATLYNRRVSPKDGNSGTVNAHFVQERTMTARTHARTHTQKKHTHNLETQSSPQLQTRRFLHARSALRTCRHKPR